MIFTFHFGEEAKLTLAHEERKGLEAISSKGYHRLQRVINALILLSGDAGEHQIKYSKCEDIARVLNISTKKIERVKKLFVE